MTDTTAANGRDSATANASGESKRVLVTGGAGFIGSHVCEALLAAGHQVAVLDNLSSGRRGNLAGRVTFYEGDIRDARFVQSVFDEVRPQWVSHQAAQISVSRSVREPRLDAEVNLLGFLTLLEAASAANTERFVFASTGGALYGEVAEPATEAHPADPISPYGIGKLAGEAYARFFSRERGLPTVALRYGNVYGPRQNPHGEAGVVAIFARRLVRGETCVINGDGGCVRDYVYVDDIARANVLALDAASVGHPAYNIGTGVGTDVRQVYAHLRDLLAPGVEAQFGPPRPGDLRSSLLDARRAAAALGWQPSVSLEEGLRRTADWFREQAGRVT